MITRKLRGRRWKFIKEDPGAVRQLIVAEASDELSLEHAQIIGHLLSDDLGRKIVIVPPGKREPNPTLVAHGSASFALWHVISEHNQLPLADLYVLTKRQARALAQKIADLVGFPVLLLDNLHQPPRLEDHPIVPPKSGLLGQHSFRARGRRRNPGYLSAMNDVAQVFGWPAWGSLTQEEQQEVMQDVAAMVAEEEFSTRASAARELRSRIGGPKNLKSYALTLVAGARRRRRTRKANPGRLNPRGPRGAFDEAAATELELFIENDADLYRQQLVPILLNLWRKMQKGKYDHKLAPKLWRYLADNGARKYAKEFDDARRWAELFSVPTRDHVARELADKYRAMLEAREFSFQKAKNPISRSIDKRSIRTVRRGAKRILIGCPKGKYRPRAHSCAVATRRVNMRRNPAGDGFAITPAGKRVSYAEAEKMERAAVAAARPGEKLFAYLSGDHRSVTTFTGAELMRVTSAVERRMAAFGGGTTRWYVRAIDPQGRSWHGSGPGPQMFVRMTMDKKQRSTRNPLSSRSRLIAAINRQLRELGQKRMNKVESDWAMSVAGGTPSDLAYRIAKARAGGRLQNPRGKGVHAKARATFRRWHEFDPSKIVKMQGPPRTIPRVLVKLGEIPEFVYRSPKYDGDAKVYTHKTGRPHPVLATDPDGRHLYVVGGKVRVTADGLVG